MKKGRSEYAHGALRQRRRAPRSAHRASSPLCSRQRYAAKIEMACIFLRGIFCFFLTRISLFQRGRGTWWARPARAGRVRANAACIGRPRPTTRSLLPACATLRPGRVALPAQISRAHFRRGSSLSRPARLRACRVWGLSRGPGCVSLFLAVGAVCWFAVEGD